MPVRSKPSKAFLRGRRRALNGGEDQYASGRSAAVRPSTASAAVPPSTGGAAMRPATGEIPRSRRQGGQSQDRALYTCSCGFAFDALVSTSVGCPHCGSTQAW
jgi:hypothetical protein